MKERPHVLAAGGLLSRDVLNQISTSDHTLPGTNPTDYGLVQGERIGDAAARSWNRLVGIWANFRQAESRLPKTDRTATTLTRDRWLKPLLEELGFVGLPRVQTLTFDEKDYPISHEWEDSVPVHQLGWRLPVDKRTPGITGAAKTSPHSLLQEFLNRSDQHLWGVVTNGQVFRLLRDNATLTRQAYCEFDLRAIFDGNAYSDFQTLWRTCHRTRFEGSPPANCYLEKWNLEAITVGTRALDQLREGVENALLSLGNGLLAHRANTQLRDGIRHGQLDADDFLRQLLRLVYRMLFLLVAESREMILDPEVDPAARDRYYQYYSMTRLRRLAERRRGTAHSDLWQSLQITMNSLHSKSKGIPALGLVPLGSFLWSPDNISDIHEAQIDNRHLLAAVHHLCFTRDTQAKALRPVDYRNLGSEELGSVYESLLELHANINGDARTFKLDTAAGSERKVTGSYYTPTVLIDRLLDESLNPLLDRAEKSPNPEKALLDLRVLDPACGSGHFLIAAAHRIAGRLATTRTNDSEPTLDELRTAVREVIGRCVYGIDINPMAVELCKVSLWLEANHNGQPLSFLDHHIVCGNSLLGTTPELLADGIPQAAFKTALTGDDRKRLVQLRKTNRIERKQREQGILALDWSPHNDISTLAAGLTELNAIQDERSFDVAVKAELYDEWQQTEEYTRLNLAADAWCAAFVIPKTNDHPTITDSTIRGILLGHNIGSGISQSVRALGEEYLFLHPHLVFPDVFEQSGGFDLVVGNPPWEKVKLHEKEWFAVRHPEIAAASTKVARQELISGLATENPGLLRDFHRAARHAQGVSALLRNSGRYPLGARGDTNTYAVFAELMRNTASPTGRSGMILPTGIATGAATKPFFADLVRHRSIVSLFDFENRKKIFPAVDSRQKFCLLTLSGREDPAPSMEFAFFVHEVSDLDDPNKSSDLTPADFRLVNPNTKTSPIFQTRRGAEIVKDIYRRFPVLVREGDPEGNPWDVTLSTMFHMSNDSHLFHTRSELESEGWMLRGNHFVRNEQRRLPIYEGKMVGLHDHRAADVVKSPTAKQRQNQPRYLCTTEKMNPNRLALPIYWVPEKEVVARTRNQRGWLAGFNDTTSATNSRTMICSAIPTTAVSYTQRLFYTSEPQHLLLALLGSFVFDFVARQKVGGTHFTFVHLKQMPVLPSSALEAVADHITPHMLELSYTAWDMVDFGKDLGYHGPPFQWNPERRTLIRAELDALMFHLYGISEADVDYIMDVFESTEKTDKKRWGEYRTKRLILERYDAMTEANLTGHPYQTALDPPPAHPSVAHDESTRPDWLSQSGTVL